jgi:PAS domain S-box-containing protein/putative nucleotidyltransferase with HDIG domain
MSKKVSSDSNSAKKNVRQSHDPQVRLGTGTNSLDPELPRKRSSLSQERGESQQESGDIYRDLIDNLHEVVFTLDTQGHFTYINPAIEQLTGYQVEEIVGSSFEQFVHADDLPGLASSFERSLKGRPEPYEFRIIDTHGNILYVHTSSRTIKKGRKTIGLTGIMVDITKQKQSELALRRRADELAAFQANALDLAVQQDLHSLLRAIVERSMALLKAPKGFIYLYDETKNELELTIEMGFPISPGTRLKMGEGMAGRVAQTWQTLIVDDYSTWEGRSRTFKNIPYHAVIESPMLFGGQLIGVLGVNDSSEEQCKFTEADAKLLLLFAGQAASAVHDVKLVQELQAELNERKRMEASLREAETRYRTLVEQIPAIVYTDSAEEVGQTYYISPQIKTMLGYELDKWSLNNDLWINSIHPDDRQRVLAEYHRTYATGAPFTSEYRLISVAGKINWIRDEAILIREPSGRPMFWQGIMLDITERKHAEIALSESEERYRRLFDLSPDAIAVHGGGKILLANTAALTLLRAATHEEVVGRPIMDFVHPDYQQLVIERARQQIAEGKVVPVREEKFICLDGTTIDVEVTAAPVHYQDKLVSLVIFRDISERKKAEAAIRESETSYRGLFNRVSEAIYIQDRDGHFLDVNEGAVNMYGYPREYLIGKTPADIGAPGKNDLKRIGRMVSKAFKGEPQQFEFWGVRSSGEVFPKEVRLYKGTYFGQDVIIALSQDITERKRADEALQRRLKELTVLHAVSMAATQASGIDELLEQVTRIIGDAVYVDDFGIALLDEARQVLQPHRSYHGETIESMTVIPLSEGVMGHVASTGKSYCVDDVCTDPYFKNIVPGTLSEICVPIKVGGRVVGVLNAESRQRAFFDEDDERLLITIAGTLATAVEKLHLFDSERTRRQEAETLREAAAAVSSSLELHQVLNAILISLKRVVPYDSASVMLLENDNVRLVAVQGFDQPEKIVNQIFSARDNLLSETQRSDKPIILADASADVRFQRWAGTDYVRGWMGVPLIVRNEVIGYITLDSREPSAYHEESTTLAQAFAYQAATAIENARLYESEQRRRQEAETLRQVAQVVTASLDVNEVIRLMLDQLKQLFTFDTGSVFVLGELGQPDLIAGINYADEKKTSQAANELLKDSPILRQMERDLKSFVIADVRERPDWIWISGAEHVRSFLAVPLISRQHMIGVLMADSAIPAFFSENDLRVAQLLAQQMAIAIENARLYQNAVQASNRRAILHQASQEIAHANQDPEQVYAAIHHAAEQLMPAEAFVITLMDEQSQETVGVYLVDKGVRAPVDRVPIGDGLAGQVISTGKSLTTNDLSVNQIPGIILFGEAGEGQNVLSILAVPLRMGEKMIGMLSVQSYKPHVYTDDDQTLLEMLAAYASVAIENARLNSETIRRLKELEAVNRISTVLRAAQTIDDMLPSLLDETLQVLESRAGAIWLYDQVSGVLIEKAARGWFSAIQEMPVKPGEGISGTVFRTGQVSISKEFATDPLARETIRGKMPLGWGGACVPIRTMRETIGVLFVSVELPRQLQADSVNLLVTLSEMAGNAIRRADLHEQTDRQLQRLASLRAVDMAINTILDLRVTLGILIDHIISQLKVDAVNILLINPKTQTLYQAAGSGFHSDAFKSARLYISDSLAGQAIRTRTTIHIPDLGDSKLLQRVQLLADEGFVTYFGVPLIAKGQVKGVLETFHRSQTDPDSEWCNFLETLAGQAAIAIDNSVLFEELQQTNLNLSLAYDATIEGWSKALDLRDQETEGHTLRVTEMTVQLADIMDIGTTDLVHIRRGALLHDIGKMGVPDSILYKAGPLSQDEWAIMHQHPEFAYQMLSPITYLRQALDIPYAHHERWDGSGYPRHLSGEQIPLAARIFAVVDVWDALISDRHYRKAFTKETAIEYVRMNSGILFDPRAVEAFLRMIADDPHHLSISQY